MSRDSGKSQRSRRTARQGSILLAVLVIVVLLTIAGMTYFRWSFSEYKASDISQRRLQTRMAAESGIEYLRVFLSQNDEWIIGEGGLSHNPSRFQILMPDSTGGIPAEPSLRRRFTVLAPAVDANGEFAGLRYGVENESARLNLNTLLVADARNPEAGLARMVLMSLPGMTETMADSILDWIDEDDDPRDFGAERDYYSGLSPSYEPQNGPLESLDQLLLVRDVTPELLYGLDRNRNFLVEQAEATATEFATVDNSLGSMNRGWVAYLTLHSAESNLRADGTPRIDINSDDLEALRDQLREFLDDEQTNFILAFRQGGAYEADSEGVQRGSDAARGAGGPGGGRSEGGDGEGEEGASPQERIESAANLDLDFEQGGSVPIGSILDLIGVRTRVVQKGQTERTIVKEAFPNEPGTLTTVLPLLLENLTATGQQVIPGRLNINQAPRPLLEGMSMAMPQIFPRDAVEQILANRAFEPGLERPEQQYETWILANGYVTLEQMKQLMPLITCRGDVMRAQVVGYYEADGPYCRLEGVFDATAGLPRLLAVRDLTPLGAGFNLDQLGRTEGLATDSP